MNIEHKKTALGDDASIYERNRDFTSKENLKSLTKKQKFRYFMDYYWKKLLVVLIIIVAVVSLLDQVVFNPSINVLSVACVNDSQIADAEGLTEALEELIQLESKNDHVQVANYNLEDAQMNMAFTTLVAADSVDILLCPYDYFMQGSQEGMFMDLSEILSPETFENLSGKFLQAQIVETDIDGNELSRGDAAPYGIDISGSSFNSEFAGTDEQMVLGILVNAPNPENALKVVDYFTIAK